MYIYICIYAYMYIYIYTCVLHINSRLGGGEARPKAERVMRWTGGCWRCRVCEARPRRGRSCLTTKCPGCPTRMVEVIRHPNGHKLMQAWEGDREEGRSLVWCTVCGCHAHNVPRNLCKPCMGRESVGGRAALVRLRGGTHPTSGLPVGMHKDLSGYAL